MHTIMNLNIESTSLGLEELSTIELQTLDGGGFSRDLGFAVGVVFFSALCGVAKAVEIMAPTYIK